MSQQKTIKAVSAITLVIMLSKVFGFLREAILAAYFGTGMAADAYAAAYGTYYIPILLFGSCISSTLIPLYIERRDNVGLNEADRLASNTLNIYVVSGVLVSAFMYLLADPIISLLYSGFDAETHALAVDLMHIMLINLAFALGAQVLMNILNAQKHFVAAQLTGFPLNVCSILAAVFFARRYGVRVMAWAVAASAVMQVLIEVPVLLKSFCYRWEFSLRDPLIRRMLILAAPAILSMSATEINNIVDKSMASNLQMGALSAMNYSFRLVTFVNGIMVVPLMTVMFSRMSEKAALKDKSGIVTLLRENTEWVTALVFPLTVIAAIASEEVIRIAFMRGAFNEESLRLTSGVFAMYILGELFFGLRDMLNRVFHAMQDTKTPMCVALFMIIINIILNILFVKLIGVNGLPLSTTVSGIIAMLLLMQLLRRRLGGLGFKASVGELARIAGAAAIAAVWCILLERFLPHADYLMYVIMRFLFVAGGGLIVYLAAAWMLGSRNIRNIKGLLRRK
ncbi:MAG: murein biosynthesis integral membrane protein MurJ [Clostridia bacterium]|nr:murein biosynthesis integral membrane protein MurJ [Clostridia bacterium]